MTVLREEITSGSKLHGDLIPTNCPKKLSFCCIIKKKFYS